MNSAAREAAPIVRSQEQTMRSLIVAGTLCALVFAVGWFALPSAAEAG